jgi:uncharacterized protein (TIRG00374 family)
MTASTSDASPERSARLRRRIWALVRLLCSAFILVLIFYSFPLGSITGELGDRFAFFVAIGTLLTLLSLLLNSARWVVVSSAIGAPLTIHEAGALTLVGHFASQFLPTSVGGDVVRVWGAWRTGIALPRATMSVLLERLVGMSALVSLIVIGLVILSNRLDSWVPLLVAGAIVAASTAGVALTLNLDRLPAQLLRGRIGRVLSELTSCVRQLLANPGSTVLAFGLSLLVQAILLHLTAILAGGFGAKLAIVDALTIVPAVLVISNLPISIGGWGVREAGLLGGFLLLGLPGEAAVGTSVLIGLVNIAGAIPGATIFVLRRQWIRSPDIPLAQGVEDEAATLLSAQSRHDRR